MEQTNKPWVVNATEATNRTCDTIYHEYKDVIATFNEKIINAGSKKKNFVIYKTDNETTSLDLHYFYVCLGYKVELDEIPEYKDGIEYTIYKLKIMW